MVNFTYFLGVVIDSKLNWSEHVKYIKNKMLKETGIIYKMRKYFKKSTLSNMYYSFIFPYLSYCIEVWGNASTCFTDTVLKLQKRAVRILISSNYKAHTEPIFF